MLGDPDWEKWEFGEFHPEDCAGHMFMHSNGQHTDMRRLGERNYRSTSKFQVLHHHEEGKRCVETCEAYGAEVPHRG
jgi:hypothetical protein